MNNVDYRPVEANLRAAMRCYARVSSQGEARDYPGLSVAWCGLDCAVFNSALLNQPASIEELRRMLAMAELHFRQRKVGWTFWLCNDMLRGGSLEAARTAVREARLELIAQPPGMFVRHLAPPTRKLPELMIRKVRTAPETLDFAHLSSVIFNLSYRTAQAIYGNPDVWAGAMEGWVGYLDGQAVSLATVVIAAGVAGVYSVGTLPSHQRRGYAEVMIRHALGQCPAGAVQGSVLQSTVEGMNLYTRLGYQPVTSFGVYIREGSAYL